MKTTIVIDNEDAPDCPLSPWTANIYDENGELLADPGFGRSRAEALAALLSNVEEEFPGFSELSELPARSWEAWK